jgi:hypothetical protein
MTLSQFLCFLAFLLIFFNTQGCSLLNSGTVHMKYTTATARFDGVEYSNKERLKSVSVSARNVQHPSLYPTWATTLSLDPSIHYDTQIYGTQTSKPNKAGKLEPLPDIEIRRLSTFANIKAVQHTPIGSFTFSGGFGLGFSRLKDTRFVDTLKIRGMGKLDLNYVAFITPRFFFMVGPRYYRDSRDEFVVAMRFGYFWGRKERKTGLIELMTPPSHSPDLGDESQSDENSEPAQD